MMSWIVGVGLGLFGAGAADVLGAVVPVSGAHPASATESATAIQPCFITAPVYREIAVTAVLAVTTLNKLTSLAFALPQHPDKHRSEHTILLAVDQEFGEGATLWVAPELADPVGSLEVGKHQDVEKLGTGSRPECVEALP
jgi:hypothetical protein